MRIDGQFGRTFFWTAAGPKAVQIVGHHQQTQFDRSDNGMRPVHPGEILREESLVPLKRTVHARSKALRVAPARINDIALERRGITSDTAFWLARYFGGDAQSWLNLQQACDLKIAETAQLRDIIATIQPVQ